MIFKYFKLFWEKRRAGEAFGAIRKAARRLDVARLMTDGSRNRGFGMDDFFHGDSSPRLFGFYTPGGIEYALRFFGLLDKIEALGYRDLTLSIGGGPFVQDLRLTGQAENQRHILIEGKFKRTIRPIPAYLYPYLKKEPPHISVVSLEWFLLQHPLGRFTEARPRLPGQQHPGLGLRDEALEVFGAIADRLHLDAFVVTPKFFHNAVIYSPGFFFIDPERQKEYMMIRKLAPGRSLHDLSLAIDGGFLVREDGEPYRWAGSEMIHPMSRPLENAFHKAGHPRDLGDGAGIRGLCFDWEGFDARQPALLQRIT